MPLVKSLNSISMPIRGRNIQERTSNNSNDTSRSFTRLNRKIYARTESRDGIRKTKLTFVRVQYNLDKLGRF